MSSVFALQGKEHEMLRLAKRATFVLSTIVALAVAIAPSVAFATEAEPFSNNTNTTYEFNLSLFHQTAGTGYRDKTDASSLYIWIKTFSGAPARLYVDGAHDDKGSGKMDCTQGIYRSHHAGEWQIYNLVRENGRDHARLTAWRESGDGWVKGEWSPDCVGQGNYGVLPG